MKTLYSYFAQILEDKQQVKQNSLQSDNLLKSNKKMRTIELTLSGICNVYWVESILDMNRVDTEKTVFELEQDGITDMDSFQEITVMLSKVSVEVNGEAISKKGKYINRKDYYSKRITNPSIANLMYCGKYMTQTFDIQLNDGEDFDPLKLQLVKTDYELDFLPYDILTDIIMYDGKEVKSKDGMTDGLMFGLVESYIIDYDLPYVQ